MTLSQHPLVIQYITDAASAQHVFHHRLCVSHHLHQTHLENGSNEYCSKITYKIYIIYFYLLHVVQQTAGDPRSLIS